MSGNRSFFLLAFLFLGVAANASEATLVQMHGAVLLDGAAPRLATPLRVGQIIATGPASEATILLSDGSIFTVREVTRMRLSRLLFQGGTRDIRVDIELGGLLSEVVPSRWTNGNFEVGTPVAVAGVRGTSFHSAFNGSEASFDVFSGQVEIMSPSGSFPPTMLGAGERLDAMEAGRISQSALRSELAPPENRPTIART